MRAQDCAGATSLVPALGRFSPPRRALLGAGAAFVIADPVIKLLDRLSPPAQGTGLTDYLHAAQDAPTLQLFALALLALALAWERLPTWPVNALRLTPWALAGLCGFVLAVAAAGAVLVFQSYPKAYDEVMAVYDAAIFASGRLIVPIPEQWRDYLPALQPSFRTPVEGNAASVSSYLPVAAALRALVGLVADARLTGPLLAAGSAALCFGLARRLQPQRPDVAAIATLIVALSPQVLTMSMTPFAMAAHLAFTLLWLTFFLRDDAKGHAGALVTGFFACGLHQFIFHPVFAAPFILRMLTQRRWRLALLYIAAYGVFVLFWASYFRFALQLSGFSAKAAEGAGVAFVIERIAAEFANRESIGVTLMLKNMARFFAWQTPILLPLLILAWRDLREDVGIARELAGGVALLLLLTLAILPYQGHSWGYRYLHGMIGSVALLAAAGWARATRDGLDKPNADSGRLLAAFAVAAVVGLASFGLQLKFAHDFAAPHVRAQAAISASDADVVLVDSRGIGFGLDLVRNDPYLRNRPLTMFAWDLEAPQIEALCARYKVERFDRQTPEGDAMALHLASGVSAQDAARTLPACVGPLTRREPR